MLDLRSLAYSSNLEFIETTSERSGYPSHIKGAIIGFNNFEQAEKLAKDNNLDIEIFEKHDGWNLYYRTGNRAFEEFENHASDYGDNYEEFDNSWKEYDFYEQFIKPGLERFDNIDELRSFIDHKEHIFYEIDRITDEELVITVDGVFESVIEKHTMDFYHDTKTVVIGLINNNNE